MSGGPVRSHFMRRRRFRPWRWISLPSGEDEDRALALLLPRPLLRPARFVVGLELADKDGLRTLDKMCESAPQSPALYLGRVEEVAENGEVTARVWEVPGGQEYIATLSPENLDEKAYPGAALRIWTWLELPDGAEKPEAAEPRKCIRVEVRNKVLTDEERAQIARVLAAPAANEEETP